MLVTKNHLSYGSVVYELTDELNLMGKVVKIDLPGHVRHELINELATNKSMNRLYGGQLPQTKIGDYLDGLWAVMHTICNKYDLEFDDSQMLVPKVPQGAIP